MRATILSALVLCLTTFVLSVTADTGCDLSIEVGDTVTIELRYTVFTADNQLVWKHNTEGVFMQKRGKVVTGKEGDVTSDGSLVLRSVTMDQKGPYFAEVFNSDGKLVYSVNKTLCVTEKLSTPSKPLIACTSLSVKLTCNVKNTNLEIMLLRNNKDIYKSGATVTLKLTEIKAADEFSCRVSNKRKSLQSGPVKVSCPGVSPGPEDKLLFGLDRYIMIAILAGLGGLFLILVVILVVCCCRRYRQNKNRLRDEEELRLANVTQQQQQRQRQEQESYAHPHGQHRQQAPPRGHAPPCPHPQNGEGQTPVPPRSRGKPRSRPPPVPTEDGEEEQPPPRPRPRQSAPRHNR